MHEVLITLFRNRPTLAPELLREALHFDVPTFDEARVVSADLTEVQPAEYRADLVVQLVGNNPTQTVVTVSEAVSRWASEPIGLGSKSVFCPLALPLARVPEVSNPAEARKYPELAVLSAMAHGADDPPARAARIALAAFEACVALDADRSRMYFDLIQATLGEAARKELQSMDPRKYEYQSELARRLVAEGEAAGRAAGKAEGMAEGKAELVLRLLALRFGPLSESDHARIAGAPLDELDGIADRLIAAKTLEEALGRH
jgi:hypothetical protein